MIENLMSTSPRSSIPSTLRFPTSNPQSSQIRKTRFMPMPTTKKRTTTITPLLLRPNIARVITSSRVVTPNPSAWRFCSTPFSNPALVRCSGCGERSGQRGPRSDTVLVKLALGGGALGSAGFFLDGLEFIEEFDPANGVFVAGFQTRAGWALEAG